MAARTARQRRFAAVARRFHGRIPKGFRFSRRTTRALAVPSRRRGQFRLIPLRRRRSNPTARRRRFGRRRRGLPKTAGGWVSFAFKIFGGVVAAGPGINVVVTDVQSGNFQTLPNDLLFAYTGLGGTTPINTQQLGVGVGSVVGGVVLAKIGSILGRMIH